MYDEMWADIYLQDFQETQIMVLSLPGDIIPLILTNLDSQDVLNFRKVKFTISTYIRSKTLGYHIEDF